MAPKVLKETTGMKVEFLRLKGFLCFLKKPYFRHIILVFLDCNAGEFCMYFFLVLLSCIVHYISIACMYRCILWRVMRGNKHWLIILVKHLVYSGVTHGIEIRQPIDQNNRGFYYHLHLSSAFTQTTVRTIDIYSWNETTMEDLRIAEWLHKV